MSASKDFSRVFAKKNLFKIYFDSIRYKPAQGIDRISGPLFEKNLRQNIEIIYRKVHSGKYEFSNYREKLILRGAQRNPRVISIPTIRDKLTHKALAEVLQLSFNAQIPLVHKVIHEVISAYKSGLYQHVLRLDVVNFFPSVRHDILLNELRRKIRKKEIIHLVKNAVSRKTVKQPTRNDKSTNNCGVPQGLSVSNILSNIYLGSIDQKYSTNPNIRYFRFVDDILIFCDAANKDRIEIDIENDFKNLGLQLHSRVDPSKSSSAELSKGFTYLGYDFQNSKISVRENSLNRIRNSIVSLLTNYKYSTSQNLKLLEWSLNLRVTGFIFNKTKYGWLFFFSQIDDLGTLASLDHLLKKQLKRYGVAQAKVKTFLRAYHEITKNLRATTYIPNFDQISLSEKQQLLIDVFGLPNQPMNSHQVEYQFRKRIYKTVKELERDLARPS